MAVNDRTHRKSWTDLQEEDDARLLRGFPSFEKFSDADLHRLVQAGHHDSSSAPWPLIHERTPSDACYILLSGEVRVFVGHDQVATLGPGEVIGESALRRGKLRSATVTTTGPTEVLRIEADDLGPLLEEVPALRDVIEANAARHAPATPAAPAASAEPARAKVNISVPAELLTRFEQAAGEAGVPVAAALEEALSHWLAQRG